MSSISGITFPLLTFLLGVDQTTRTSERWTLLAPALEERYDITSAFHNPWHRLYIRALLTWDFSWDAFDKLAQYKRPIGKALSTLSTLPGRTQNLGSSSLESLPTEIVSVILTDPILSFADVLSLGLSSRVLWGHVLYHVAQTCRTAPWANTPVVCTGTWTMSLPPAIHKLNPDIKRQEEVFFNRPGRGPRGAPSRGMCPARSFNWDAVSNYKERIGAQGVSTWMQAFEECSEASRIPTDSLKVLGRSLEIIVNPNKSSMPTSWVLRNHMTKEYVSLKAGMAYEKHEHHIYVKGAPKLSLDNALLMRVCWSAPYMDESKDDHDGESMGSRLKNLAEMKRGPWAGHFFDVVPTDRESQDVGELAGWCDVTKELMREAAAWEDMSEEG